MGQRDCHHGRDVGVICQGRVGVKTPVTGLIVTMHQHLWHTTPCRSCVLSDCGHTSSQWSTLHWIHCEPHLPHTPTTTWGGGDLPVERLCPLHISSCCKHQPTLCHSHHWERPPSHSKIPLSGLLQKSTACLRKHCHHCTR